ncbi:MAG: TetR/AcrR family transcriptional regulator [Actinobacteria bacterium]|jgi:AcrR family transcriptional regulator|nr:MAG: TetR/AcrR family transcriptional regulator [Actinomycetota bacterium]
MPRPERSSEEIGAVREEIIGCAMDILVEEGYSNLSMAKIGARMNMTAANVYNYFTNKEHIFLEIHDRAFQFLYESLKSAVDPREDPRAKVRALIETYVEFGIRHSRHYEIMFCVRTPKYSDYEGTMLEKIVMDAKRVSLQAFDLAVQTVEEALASLPGMRAEDARMLTVQTWSMLHGLVSLYNNRTLVEAVENPEEIIAEILGQALRPWGWDLEGEAAKMEISFAKEEEGHGI